MHQQKGKVLILGTFHMSAQEELYSVERQRQIEKFVSKIERFAQKNAVEMVAEENDVLCGKYS